MPEWRTEENVMDDVELKEPSMYKVILNNDDYTPMDFVVMVLMTVFHKDEDTAQRVMLDVHQRGKGICGVFTFEVAETKVKQVEILAERHKHPLLCTMEPE